MKSKDKKQPKRPPLDADKTLQQLGNRIRELRLKSGYSNYEHFAYEHEFSRAQYGRYENGQDLRMSSLVKVVNAFGITLEEFFAEGFE